MRELLTELRQSLDASAPFVYCRLVATRGSTPQKPGAAMLVYPGGRQAGTLGGGCVEAEVKRRALAMAGTGRADILHFDLDQDYGWDDGLICGGRMEVLVDDVSTSAGRRYYHAMVELIEEGCGYTEAIVIDGERSSLPPATGLLFDSIGESRAARVEVGGESLERVRAALRPIESRPGPYLHNGVSFLPLGERCRLLIIGGGHVGLAVGELAAQLDFDIWVVDDREEYVTEERFPFAARRIAGDLDDVLPTIDVTTSTYALIVTRGHRHDQTSLYHLLERPMRYLGMIGSRRKIRLIFDRLRDEGCARERLAAVHAPLGLAIGSRTVSEIAVSICAELVAHRNLLGVIPGRPNPNAIVVAEGSGDQEQVAE